MKTVSAYKARTNFGELLNEIYYRGEEVIVEKMGKPVAVMIPFRGIKTVSDSFTAAAGSWGDIKVEKLIDKIYKDRKDSSGKRKFLASS